MPSNEPKPRFLAPLGKPRDYEALGGDPHTDVTAFIAYVKAWIDRPRFVYFIREVAHSDIGGVYGPVKIGEAFDPPSRLRELQCGNSNTLELQAAVFATEHTEKSLHLQWASVAGMRGEWFGRGFEQAIVDLAQHAQHAQVDAFEGGKQPYLIAQEALWTIGHPKMASEAA